VTTTTRRSRPGRTLIVLAVIVGIIYGIVAGGFFLSDARWAPGLALDLEGGTQIILEPEAVEDGAEIPGESIDQAVEIIRQRVNGTGVTEAEVTRQGAVNIVVALPGQADEETLDLVRQSAQLEFRPVLLVGGGFDPSLLEPTAEPSDGAEPSAPSSVPPSVSPWDGASAEPTAAETQGRPAPRAAVPAAATEPTGEPTADPNLIAPPTDAATAEPVEPVAEPAPEPTDASDPAFLTPEVLAEFQALSCLDPNDPAAGVTRVQQGDPDQPLVVCSSEGFEKYVLGPVEVAGTNVDDAQWGFGQGQTGASTGQVVVNIQFDGQGTSQFADVSRRLFGLEGDRNRFGIVLDGVVISAPTMNGIIPNGEAQISGNFTQESAEALANQLRFGALPLSFEVQSTETISATLGSEQLRLGLLAGVIGLLLVVVYSLIQYRALGLVTVASLLIAGLITYGLLLIFSWRQGYRLSLPAVAGLIVAIGITADSFIVFFERIRDEIRDGRSLEVAVERGWERARRTILASDAVSFLAAVVLYLLAVGGVRGFAFTLGLTTIVDLIVVFLFTKPLVTLLARTKFFGGGHKWSGFDPEHLGSTVARRAVRSGARVPASDGPTIAERKKAERDANQGAVL
jgi:preprotein translocase subunit SecD